MAKYSEPVNAPAPENASSKTSDTESTPAPSKTRHAATSADGSSEGAAAVPGRKVTQRKNRYLIASRHMTDGAPGAINAIDPDTLEQTLRNNPDIDFLHRIGVKAAHPAVTPPGMTVPGVFVASMTEQQALRLLHQAQGRLIIEPDQYLFLQKPGLQQARPTAPPLRVPDDATRDDTVFQTTLTILGQQQTPVKDVNVYLYGSSRCASGVTDERGQVQLSLQGDTAQTLHSLHVDPPADYWSCYCPNPDLSTEEANVLMLHPLSDMPSLAHFPAEQVYGWGGKAMRLDQLPKNYRAQGVRIALIDAGTASSHPDLRKIRYGFDALTRKATPGQWNDDRIADATHAAGTIVGAENDIGIRGFAPDAELHSCKVFPEGRISHLMDALEYCIQQQIDVVNLGVGDLAPSEILEQELIRAQGAGVACITGAGDAAGAVPYPASSPHVLTVGAIGKLGEFPSDSYHVHAVTTPIDSKGYFAAAFCNQGPEIALCAPGVAIVSTAPTNSYCALDGTATAAPHISGLCALILAHHPDFQGNFKARNAERVGHLFQILQLSARALTPGLQQRTGAGLPDAMVAVGLQTRTDWSVAATVPSQATMNAFANITPVNVAASMQARQSVLPPLMTTPGPYGMAAPYPGQAPVLSPRQFGGAGWMADAVLSGVPGSMGAAWDVAAYAQTYGVQQNDNGGAVMNYQSPVTAFGRSGW